MTISNLFVPYQQNDTCGTDAYEQHRATTPSLPVPCQQRISLPIPTIPSQRKYFCRHSIHTTCKIFSDCSNHRRHEIRHFIKQLCMVHWQSKSP